MVAIYICLVKSAIEAYACSPDGVVRKASHRPRVQTGVTHSPRYVIK